MKTWIAWRGIEGVTSPDFPACLRHFATEAEAKEWSPYYCRTADLK